LDIDTVDSDSTSLDLENSEESETKSGLTSSSSADNTDLEAVVDIKVKTLENLIKLRSVSKLDALQGNVTLLWPVTWWDGSFFNLLHSGLKVYKFLNFLHLLGNLELVLLGAGDSIAHRLTS